MLVLLSSQMSPRYKEDILRCLAAPVGTKLQFRYEKRLFAPNVSQELTSEDADVRKRALKDRKFKEALVCFINTEPSGDLPITPVRLVEIESCQPHGSTVSLVISMKDLAFARTADFTSEIKPLAQNNNPAKQGKNPDGTDKVTGYWVFSITDKPNCLQNGATLTLWEKVASELHEHRGFQDQPFFWTVVRCSNTAKAEPSVEAFAGWQASIAGGKDRRICVYHFHPKAEPAHGHKLTFKAYGPLELISPDTMAIDSKYDMKVFWIRGKRGLQRADTAWLRIQVNDGYHLELPIEVQANWFRNCLWVAVAGGLIAAPTILSTWQQNPLPQHPILITAGAVAFGLLAAIAARFGIDRLD